MNDHGDPARAPAPLPATVGRVRLGARRLTTAEILYHMPDHPSLLQTFIWQTSDEAPRFPRIAQFLDHWRREVEAVIHSVRIAHADGPWAGRWRAPDFWGELR